MLRINFPIYLICIAILFNWILALPTDSTIPTSTTATTTTRISTIIQYPINSDLTKNGIIYYNNNNNNNHRHQYHHTQHYHQHKNQQYNHENNNQKQQQQSNLGYLIGNCLTRPNISNCITKLAIDTIEIALKDNNTWNINPYISMVPNNDWHPKIPNDNQKKNNNEELILTKNHPIVVVSNNSLINNINKDLGAILYKKIQDFAESRSIRVSLIPTELNEARSKKGGGKDKGGAMVGVMVMVGVMAQMFMGKVLMLAGGAFLISKLALLFSILSGLKKSGGGSDHVIYTESSGGSHSGGHGGGWNRQLESPGYHGDVVQRKNFL